MALTALLVRLVALCALVLQQTQRLECRINAQPARYPITSLRAKRYAALSALPVNTRKQSLLLGPANSVRMAVKPVPEEHSQTARPVQHLEALTISSQTVKLYARKHALTVSSLTLLPDSICACLAHCHVRDARELLQVVPSARVERDRIGSSPDPVAFRHAQQTTSRTLLLTQL